MPFRHPSYRIYTLVHCRACGAVSEYRGRGQRQPCSFCNPECSERGQQAERFALRFVPEVRA